jgi:hypothetical protein
MGLTGSGKSTVRIPKFKRQVKPYEDPFILRVFCQFINLLSNDSLAVSSGLKSCTSRVQVARTFELGGRLIELIDTPGFDDTSGYEDNSKSETQILKMIALFLASS